MRQSIGGAWLFTISIVLMMFIIAYVTITIDYANAYQLKDDVILYIEQYNGLNKDSGNKILARMKAKKYTTKLNCSKFYDSTVYYNSAKYDGIGSSHYYGLVDYDKTDPYKAFSKDAKTAYICVYRYHVQKGGGDDKMDKIFYSISTAFGFNFPIIGDVFDYRVTGETGTINYEYTGKFKFDD